MKLNEGPITRNPMTSETEDIIVVVIHIVLF